MRADQQGRADGFRPGPAPVHGIPPPGSGPAPPIAAPHSALRGAAACECLPAKLWRFWAHGAKPTGGNVPAPASCPSRQPNAGESAGNGKHAPRRRTIVLIVYTGMGIAGPPVTVANV